MNSYILLKKFPPKKVHLYIIIQNEIHAKISIVWPGKNQCYLFKTWPRQPYIFQKCQKIQEIFSIYSGNDFRKYCFRKSADFVQAKISEILFPDWSAKHFPKPFIHTQSEKHFPENVFWTGQSKKHFLENVFF